MSTGRQRRVFISRTNRGRARIAEQVAAVLRERGVEPVLQTEFLPSVRQMLQKKLFDCDAALCLIGPTHGGEAGDAIRGFKGTRTEKKHFSFTQLEFLVARDLRGPSSADLGSSSRMTRKTPPEVFDSKLGNRSALEWVIDQYRVTRNAHGRITIDPSRPDDGQYKSCALSVR